MVYRERSTWVVRDVNILKDEHEIDEIYFTSMRNLKNIMNLYKCICEADLVFTWFANDHSFIASQFAKILRKPILVAVGGGDVTAIRTLEYGNLLRYPWKFYVSRSLNSADLILSPSFFTKKEILTRLKKVNPEKVLVLYHGFNPEKYLPHEYKEDMVVTIGFIDRVTVFRKGFIYVVRVAKFFPNVRFIIIGKARDNTIDILKSMAPPNVKFMGFLPEKDLIRFLQKSKVYVQPSLYESFGCAVVEAMLAENVPVVTKRGALPEVVGPAGIYVSYGDIFSLRRAIKTALNRPELGKKARARAMKLFNIYNRKQVLLRIVRFLLEEKRK